MVKPAYSNIHDANGFSVHDVNGRSPVGEGAFIHTSFGGASDRQRMIWQFERQELEKNFSPKSQKTNEDLSCIKAAEEALSAVQMAVNKVPQPSWVSDTQQFPVQMQKIFDASARSNDIPKSKMDSAVERYDLFPQTAAQVSHKIDMVNQQIQQMDTLIKSIDEKFTSLTQHVNPEELKRLSAMGITSVDGIYAIDPGYFKPKDANGNVVEYDPANLIHGLQAIEYFLQDPGKAKMDNMRMFGPRAIEELRMIMEDRTPAEPGKNFGVQPSLLRDMDRPRSTDPNANPDDDNNPNNNGYNRRNRFNPGLLN